ncbi:MAG TPA: substrate-binding domain-containing protein, partial [Burkholderiaceae bacterium]
RTLAKYPIGIAMPIHHALAQEPHLTLGQTMGYRHIVPSEPLLIHERVQAIYARGRINEKQTIACNDTRLIRSLIQQDAGIGILSYLDVASDVQDGHLAFVPLQGRQVKPLTLALCVASHRQLSRAVQLVIARIAQAFQDFAEPRK